MLIFQPTEPPSLGDVLNSALRQDAPRFNLLRGAIAFAKESGLRHLSAGLSEFVGRGGEIRLVIGIDHRGTSIEALRHLLTITAGHGQILINHDEDPYVTFHPKVYLFEGPSHALLITGSGNLTEGGLFTNDEACVVIEIDKADPASRQTLDRAQISIDLWSDQTHGTVRELSEELLTLLADQRYALPERENTPEDEADQTALGPAPPIEAVPAPAFQRGPARRRPRRPRTPGVEVETPTDAIPRGFAMTLMRTDVGTGQTTPGTAARSPEVFIPLHARDLHPQFWAWPDRFSQDPDHPGKFDRWDVPISLGGQTIPVNMMTWPDKHDFRLRSEALRSAGQEGDIMKIERVLGRPGLEYHVEIIPLGTTAHTDFLRVCFNRTPNSRRLWGYYD